MRPALLMCIFLGVPQSFDPEFIRQLTDGDCFEAEARKVVDESDRKRAENKQFRKDHPLPYEAMKAWVNMSIAVVAIPSSFYVVASIAFGGVPPAWAIVAMAAGMLYVLFVRWPAGLPLPHHTGLLDEKSRKALLDNASRAARNNTGVIEELGKSSAYILFLRSFDAEFTQARRTEDVGSHLEDEPYRIKQYAPDAEMLLLKNLLKRTRIPSVINVLAQVPELSSGRMSDQCEELLLPSGNWLECVKRLAAGAKASIFVISSRRGEGITLELDSLRLRGVPVMAVCEKSWLESYAGHLPENVLVVTDTQYKYEDTEPPSLPVLIRIERSVTEKELQEYDRRLKKLLAESAPT